MINTRFSPFVLLRFGLLISILLPVHATAGSWLNNQSLGGFNTVNIYTPDSNSTIGEGKALLIVLHGCVQPVSAYLNANLEAAAERHGMVIAVPDAMNKAGFSCWSYWQGTKSRSSGDYKNLISLAQTMANDASRNIDLQQVYIAGLSSGAAFANTTACLAPDVFAGMGISAGPSIGTSSNGALGPCEAANVAARCAQYGAGYNSYFDTQLASIAQGDQDSTVNLCYNQQNASGMADLYGVSELPTTQVITEGPSRTADETLWQDGRVSKLWFNNVDHAWSGGLGASGAYISASSINYADYLGEYFATYNLRVDRNAGPVLSNISVQIINNTIQVNGTAIDDEGDVSQVLVSFAGSDNTLQSDTGSVDSAGNFTLSSGTLPDDLYKVTIIATDNDGKDSNAYIHYVRIGPPPAPAAPSLSNILINVNEQCATLSADVADINNDIATVTVLFGTTSIPATLEEGRYVANACALPDGPNTATITAVDDAGLSASESVEFTIDAGKTATLDQHISNGRLAYANYANCYLEYSTSAFTLREVPVNTSQCQWQDTDASCTGPVQACSADGSPGSQPPPEENTCVQYSTYNYYHKMAGRAYSTGNPYAPDYFAQGSDVPLAGSTYGVTILNSTDNNQWQIGSCP